MKQNNINNSSIAPSDSATSHLPFVSEQLIKVAEERYPNEYPTVTASDREIWVRCGNLEVVRWLREIREAQNNSNNRS